MAWFKLTIEPVDPLISRDSRPFGQGSKIRSLSWLTPSTVCGALRSRVGKLCGFEANRLKTVKVRGPFLQCGDSLYFPRPLDYAADREKGYAIRPHLTWNGEGTEMPLGLSPAFLQNPPADDFKPEQLPAFWPSSEMKTWLTAPPESLSLATLRERGLPGPKRDERVHVSIDPATGAAEDSLLFSTTGLDFRIEKNGAIVQLSAAIEVESSDEDYGRALADMPRLHSIGGERRLADWRVEAEKGAFEGWRAPQMPEGVSRLRMILATPAIFSGGWRPGWISEGDLCGTIPGTEMSVRLVSAVIGRWEPISGWSYRQGKHGIKPLRRMVPAGSVYFFETSGTGAEPAGFNWGSIWLRSVCDSEHDRNDGFGAALWGVW